MFQDLPTPPVDPDRIVIADYVVPNERAIVVAASRDPVLTRATSDAVTILSTNEVDRLGEARLTPLLRLAPSTALAETGPAGTQAQLRIRGAEANHTLLFIDGIKANDPAAGNEARFELLDAALGDRLEILRGPQSALWGAEAIGGVVTVSSQDPAYLGSRWHVFGEAGSNDSFRTGGSLGTETGAVRLRGAVGHSQTGGIDSFGADGERDGYRQTNARLAALIDLGGDLSLAASGFVLEGRSEFDGFDPDSFLRADTLDTTENRLGAGRLEIRHEGPLELSVAGGLLASQNVNLLDEAELNRTNAERLNLSAEASRNFSVGDTDHRFTVALDYERDDFAADDVAFGGFTRQQRDRDLTALVAEWRMTSPGLSMDAAIRHDMFGDFADATSVSAGIRIPVTSGFSLAASYGEGIAQPSFYDLYGFFPGSFVGNPDLTPEKSRGFDLGLRFDSGDLQASLTWFDQRLDREIVDVFDSETFTSTTANGDGESRRQGLEAEVTYKLPFDAILGINYSYLDATNPAAPDGTRLSETRRPEHRAALYVTGRSGSFTYGASAAYVGARFDTDFDLFPAERVRLDPYLLASARIAYAVTERAEIWLRGDNLFDTRYQDVVGYARPGRGIYVGIALHR
ncbi:TonB-dependent receptor plug domain-containing protein [Sphingomicrobium sediminis]|uniref:TonB-dependent receptor n=1 Tax=Sphingomicrobium sediminis TaxID=2950949 RepID=A0A9X2EG53_9SPHN|nr:TonB-dependent receptor [Sphingomicrobium sediminis]MCM8556761.1 TonB-dependent receptor [Sphingomicrobium sediminis]